MKVDAECSRIAVEFILTSRKKKKFSFSPSIQVNDTMFSFKDNGILIVVVDACLGTVSGNKLFSGVDIKRVDGYLKSGIPQRYV